MIDLSTLKVLREITDDAARIGHGGYPDKSLLKLVDHLDHFITTKISQTLPKKKDGLRMQDLVSLDLGLPETARIYDVKDIQHVIGGPTFFIAGERTDFVTVAEVREIYNAYEDVNFRTELSLLADGVYHSVERIQLLGIMRDMRQEEYALVFSDSK